MKTMTITRYILATFMMLSCQFMFGQEYRYEDVEYNSNGDIFFVKPSREWNKVNDIRLFEIMKSVYHLDAVPVYNIRETFSEDGFTFAKYDQYFNGRILYGSDLIVKRSKDNVITAIIGTPRDVDFKPIPVNDPQPYIDLALQHLGDKPYRWLDSFEINFYRNQGKSPDELKPTFRFCYAPAGNIFTGKWVLTCIITVITTEPAEYEVFVDVEKGQVVNMINNLHPANGTGASLYSGNVNINTTTLPNRYVLYDSINKIKTLDCNGRTSAPVNFNDPNNVWDSVRQKAAVDVHYGIVKVYDYYKNTHSWNSYDNAGSTITNWVHYGNNVANAFWANGDKAMKFGDGDNKTNAWVSLDICGHEFTHAIISRTAGLIYQGESGALNEGWADIFGANIEFYAKGNSGNWALFEDLQKSGNGFSQERLMSDPKNCSCPWSLPDTYKGGNWRSTTAAYDFGGVHFNSQVAAYWYYLLTIGGSGTNDANDNYDVTGIGRAKAEKIAFKALRRYLIATSDYKGARKATLLAAEDLYGKTSEEYKQVCNAWFAVNVGDKCCPDSIELEFDVKDAKCIDSKDGEIKLTVKKSNGPFEYKWYKGDTTNAVLSTSKDLTGLDTGKYVAWVKDTVAKCEVVDETEVKAPEKVDGSISGGGIYVRPCDRRPEIYLDVSGSGGTPPYTYSWPNGRLLVASQGSIGSSGTKTATITDKNGCKGQKSAFVFFIPILCSYDPNDIIGPPSYGDKKFVSKFATQTYKVRFENDPKFATAPASRVSVDLPIDNNMDMNTFRVSSFGFNNWTFSVPNNVSTYQQRLDLRDSLGIYVDVTAGIDVSSKKAFWIFESIDPATGLPPTSGTRGFLPVNDTSKHNGEGFVDFTIKAKTNTVTGDSLRAKAEIVFDNNPSIFTPRIHNIIDAKAPVSSIDSMPPIIDSLQFPITFEAQDDNGGSGVGGVELLVSENNGPYISYAKNITDTFVIFRGNSGSLYKFYTVASDNVENKEAAKTNPDLVITISPKNFLNALDSGLSICVNDTLDLTWKKVPITTFNLQYSVGNQAYVTLQTGLSGADTIFRWKVPNITSGSANVRIRAVSPTTGSVLDSTRLFIVRPIPAVNLGNDTFYCEGSSINLVLDAGSGYASYLWNNNSTSQTIGVNTEGAYSVTVTNSFNCTASDEVTVTKAIRPTIASKTVSNIACFGNTNGSITLSTSGGKSPYTFLWNTSDTTQSLSGLSAGTYHILITDKRGCFVRDTSVITEPGKIVISKTFDHVKCKNGNDGSINIGVSGGTAPYSYLWSNSASTEDISTLTAGTYMLTVTDNRSCIARDTTLITEPALLTSSKTSVNVKCKNGSDGSIDLTVSGGVPPYTYVWSNSATTQDVSSLAAGTYTVVITDANNCIRRDTVIITEPALLTVTKNLLHVKCKSGNDGSIDLTVSGGTTAYTYVWSNSASTQDLSSLSAGTYSVLITDANGCALRDTTVITEPALLVSSKSSVNVLCKNGNNASIDLSVSGGTSPYSYLWSNSATTQDISALTAGTYTVRITDNNGCIARDTVVITEPALLAAGKTIANVKCKNESNGSINLTVNGGVSPYSYLWSNSATTEDISSLVAGTYSVRITDFNGCILRDTSIVTEPALLVSTKTTQNVKCKGGSDASINLTVTGGTTPYSYLWSNSATTEDLSGLSAGTYTVVITDANACVRRDTVVITEPALLITSKSPSNVACKGNSTGSIDLSVSGGTTPYTYLWSNSATTQDLSNIAAGTYTVLVTDANGCIARDTATITEPTLLVAGKTPVHVTCNGGNNASIDLTVSGGVSPYSYLWSNSTTTQDLSSLTAGTYIVRITDANSCVLRDTTVITQPAKLATTRTVQNVGCKNGNTGSIDMTVTGGTTPYTYLWSNSATTQDISGLTAGTYIVTITDANACTKKDTIIITEPALLVTSKSFQNVRCKNGNTGSIDLSVSGGTTPYNYLWSNSATTQDLASLTAGTYTVRVTDFNGCIARDTVIITEPTLLVSTKTFQHVLCKNGNNGSIDLSVSGGTTPYTYLWNTSATTQDLSSLTAGTYTVRVTDGNSCIVRDTVIITEPALLVSSKTFQNVRCKNGNTGSIDLTVTGGVSPYAYLWNNSAVTQDISSLVAGTYTVRITDANGCIRRDTVVITEPALLIATHTFQNVKCKNGNDGSIDLTVTGGTTPYIYMWSNGGGTQDLNGLVAGKYTVVVADNNGCVANDTVNITEPALLVATHTFQDVKCFAGNTGSIDLSVTGGVTPYTYQWSNSATTQDITNLVKGTYIVRVTDANACTDRDTVVINEPTLLLSNITVNDVLCFGGNDGSITALGTGGTLPYTYQWSSGENTSAISGKIKGVYSVVITDGNSCVRRDTLTIKEPTAPLALSKALDHINCYDGSDGQIDLTVTGGTIPYSFAWNNSATTEDLNNVKEGTYSIRITDKNNCFLLDTSVLTQPLAPLSNTVTILDVKCFGGNDGSADLTVSGGTSPYTFAWSNAASTEDINTLIKGDYMVTVTDANNCILKDTVTVRQPSAPLASALVNDNINCFGGNDGSVTANISGGTLPYVFNWSNGALTKDLTNVPQGKYVLTVTDSNNCILKDSITLTEPAAPLTAAMTVDDVDCYGDNTGAISLLPSGGTPGYTFNWSNGASSQNISGLVQGSYHVTVTDVNSCVFRDTAVVPEPPELLLQAYGTSATKSATNGYAWVEIQGGTAPYTIKWDDSRSQATDTAVNLGTGMFIVTVTDAKGCSKIDTVLVIDAPEPASIAVQPNPSAGNVVITNLSALGLDEPITIEVFDMTGKMFMNFNVVGKDIHSFDLYDSFADGTYIIKIRNSRGVQNRRLIFVK